jgi:hypothetical protein
MYVRKITIVPATLRRTWRFGEGNWDWGQKKEAPRAEREKRRILLSGEAVCPEIL